jgi:hypothetical protein
MRGVTHHMNQHTGLCCIGVCDIMLSTNPLLSQRRKTRDALVRTLLEQVDWGIRLSRP